MNRRTALATLAAAPISGVAQAETVDPLQRVKDAYAAFEEAAKALVPEKYGYGGIYVIGDRPMIGAKLLPDSYLDDGPYQIKIFPFADGTWSASTA